MTKAKYITLIFVILAVLLVIPTVSNATKEITVTRNLYSMDGSMKFTFKGLTIDTAHEYEYGITKTSATAVETWYLVTESTATSVTANIMTGTKQMREVINVVDTGYITIKDKTTDTIILEPYAVDLKLPYLRVTNYEVIDNGKNIDGDYKINVPLRNASNSKAYYKYEKVTDEKLIKKYKEIKANSGDYTALESLIKTSAPTSGYSTWGYWNEYGTDGLNGYGYTTRTVNAPDEGLYYLWLFFSGENIKNLYGCILVDNLEPDIAVDGISLPGTETVELGKNITLSPTFNPTTATNKIVTWSSSDETVATVDNAGKITPIKVGSTIITVITQDGSKKATCTVTVVATNSGSGTNGGNDGEVKRETVEGKSYGEPLPAEGVASLKDGYLYYAEDNSKEQEKIEGVSNIKQLFIANIGTGVNKAIFVVTEDGTVYRLDSKKKLVIYEELSKYKVSEIVKCEGETKAVFTLLLTDDSTAIVEVKLSINEEEKTENNVSKPNEEKKDNTTATEQLPHTGLKLGFILVFVVVLCVGIAYIKCNKYREI